MSVGRQVKAFIAAAGVVTASVLTQVNTATVLVFTLVVVWMSIETFQHITDQFLTSFVYVCSK